MSARNRARRAWRTTYPRGRVDLPPIVTVAEMVEAQPKAPEKPVAVTVSTETDEQRTARLRKEAAARLPYSIMARRSVRYGPAVPLEELEAWMSAHYPKAWERMQAPIAPSARRKSG